MNWLKKVAELHEDYLRMVKSFGEELLAEDIVQEMYIKLSKYADADKVLRKNGQINKSYIFLTLRCLYYDLQKERNKIEKVDIEEIKPIGVTYDYISEDQAYSAIIEKIEEETESWHWYDKMMYELYRDSGKSMRDISAETRISVSSIYQTIKYCKKQIRNKVGEDYEDYKNEEYELIK